MQCNASVLLPQNAFESKHRVAISTLGDPNSQPSPRSVLLSNLATMKLAGLRELLHEESPTHPRIPNELQYLEAFGDVQKKYSTILACIHIIPVRRSAQVVHGSILSL